MVQRKAKRNEERGQHSSSSCRGRPEKCRGAGRGAGVPAAPLTLAVPLVDEQLVALLAAALEAAHRVPADVVAAAVVEPALVDVWWGQGTCVTLGCSVGRAGSSPPDPIPSRSRQTEETLWALMVTGGMWLLVLSGELMHDTGDTGGCQGCRAQLPLEIVQSVEFRQVSASPGAETGSPKEPGGKHQSGVGRVTGLG